MVTSELERKVYIGPAGWDYPDWDGIVYPFPKPRGFDALPMLAAYFNLIEINSTFYHVPAPHVCRSWLRRVDRYPDFRFTVKAHQSLTHRVHGAPPPELAPFAGALEILSDTGRVGAVLLQFPWSFRDAPESRAHLSDRVDALRAFPLAVEVRHTSWESPDASAFLNQLGVTVCGVDQPVIGESRPPYLHTPGPAGAYFRLHGRNYRTWFARDAGRDARYDYLYSDDELGGWADTIREAAAGTSNVFVVLNNHFRGQAPANAFALTAMVLGRTVKAPRRLRDAYPALARWTTPDGFDREPAPRLFD